MNRQLLSLVAAHALIGAGLIFLGPLLVLFRFDASLGVSLKVLHALLSCIGPVLILVAAVLLTGRRWSLTIASIFHICLILILVGLGPLMLFFYFSSGYVDGFAMLLSIAITLAASATALATIRRLKADYQSDQPQLTQFHIKHILLLSLVVSVELAFQTYRPKFDTTSFAAILAPGFFVSVGIALRGKYWLAFVSGLLVTFPMVWIEVRYLRGDDPLTFLMAIILKWPASRNSSFSVDWLSSSEMNFVSAIATAFYGVFGGIIAGLVGVFIGAVVRFSPQALTMAAKPVVNVAEPLQYLFQRGAVGYRQQLRDSTADFIDMANRLTDDQLEIVIARLAERFVDKPDAEFEAKYKVAVLRSLHDLRSNSDLRKGHVSKTERLAAEASIRRVLVAKKEADPEYLMKKEHHRRAVAEWEKISAFKRFFSVPAPILNPPHVTQDEINPELPEYWMGLVTAFEMIPTEHDAPGTDAESCVPSEDEIRLLIDRG